MRILSHPLLKLCLAVGMLGVIPASCTKEEKNEDSSLLLAEAPDDEFTQYFKQHWEEVDEVTINRYGFEETHATPWSKGGGTLVPTGLPEEIMNDVKKADGWEMPFCYLNSGEKDINFFGLYNSRTGILRLFIWMIPSENATNTTVEVSIGSPRVKGDKYPLYNMLSYAIPSSHKGLNNYESFYTKSNYTFKNMLQSPLRGEFTTYAEGWIAVDVDMSAYNPDPLGWPLVKNEEFHVDVRNESVVGITLSGAMSATTAGKYSGDIKYPQTATANGVGSVFGGIKSATPVANFVFSLIKNISGKDLSPISTVLGVICDIGTSLSDAVVKGLDAQRILPEMVIDSLPGKINLNTKGTVDLSGYLKSWVKSNVPYFSFYPKSQNPELTSPNFGHGVWSLQNDPVIYVVDDVMMGDEDFITLNVVQSGLYFNSEARHINLRMLQFLDPSSIALNLNRNVFSNIDSVRVTYCYGVCPGVPAQSTLQHSKFLGLNRPTIPIITDDAKFYNSEAPGKNIKYCWVSKEKLICDALEETEKNSKIVNQKKDDSSNMDYSYFGNVISTYTREFIPEPQILFPITRDSKYGTCVKDGVIPDLEVLVNVVVKSDGRWYTFSKRFLPEIKLIKSSEIQQRINQLETYSSLCADKKAVSTLANDSSVPVYHPGGARNAKKALMTLKAVKSKLGTNQ